MGTPRAIRHPPFFSARTDKLSLTYSVSVKSISRRIDRRREKPAGLLPFLALLRYHQAPRGGQQQHRNEAFLLEPQRGLPHPFDVRARVMNQDEPMGADMGQEPPHLLFAQRHVAIAKQDVNRAVDPKLQTRFVAAVCESNIRQRSGRGHTGVAR